MMADPGLSKDVQHLGVRFYRRGSVDVMLVPLMKEVATYARSAGDGYYLVTLLGDPGTAYPLNLRSAVSIDPEYLEEKFKLDRRGFGYRPDELAETLHAIAGDLEREERMDR
jgi:hypothetical protein